MSDLTPPAAITPVEVSPFAHLVDATLARLTSVRSRRVYHWVYRGWQEYCANNRLDPLFFDYVHVKPFIETTARSKSTANLMLSAMRTLARQATLDFPQEPAFERVLGRLQSWSSPGWTDGGHTREKHVLTMEQVVTVVNTWSADDNRSRRNRALLRVLFYAGLRRFEAAQLQWQAVDLERGVITVAGGKGKDDDETDAVPILAPEAVQDLAAWQTICAPVTTYVFPSVRKNGALNDRPISGNMVRKIVKETEGLSGVPFNPHDARRTIITHLIDQGNNLRDVQSFARHAQSSTTMIYAQRRDAEALGKRLKL